MQKEIIFSIKEYKEKYNEILEKYLSTYVEFEEYDFVLSQLENYEKYHNWIIKIPHYEMFFDPKNFTERDIFIKEIKKKAYSITGPPNTITIFRSKYSSDYPEDEEYYKGEKYHDYKGELDKQFTINFRKIIDFLTEKKDFLNPKTKILTDRNTEDALSIDLSKSSATEKIIFLHKIGVLKFLKKQSPFNVSVNSLATVVTAITGENLSSIQPMLNSIFSEKTDQSKNPLNSTKAVNRVDERLIKIGYHLDKTN